MGAVLGHEAHAGVEDLAGAAPHELLPLEPDRAAGPALQAQQGLGELGLAVALHARDAEHLAVADLEVHVVQEHDAVVVGDAEAAHLEGHLAGLGGRLVEVEGDGAAHHEGGELGLVGGGVRGPHDPPAPDHGDAVRDGLDLAELVGDEDDRGPLVPQLAHDAHQLVGLVGGEHGGGLVEHEHLRLPRQRLDDLHALLGADGEVLDDGVGVDVEVEAGGELADRAPGGGEVEEAEGAGLVAEHDVLGDGERRHQHEVLVDHADPRAHGVAGAAEADRGVVQQDLAAVGPVQPVQHVHQRGLARSVLPQQGVDLTGLDHEVDRIVGHEGAEDLRDPSELELHACSLRRGGRCRFGTAGA